MSKKRALLLLGALLSAGHAEVIVLEENSFEKEVSAAGGLFVKFYAPWCGHCKKLTPTWDSLGERTFESGARIGRVDCTQHRALCEAKGIRSFPTLLYFADGKVEVTSTDESNTDGNNAAKAAAAATEAAEAAASTESPQTIYKFAGPRTEDRLASFVDGGYKSFDIYDPTAPPPPKGGFKENFAAALAALGLGWKGGALLVLGVVAVIFLSVWGIISLSSDDAAAEHSSLGGSGGAVGSTGGGSKGSNEDLVMVEKDGSTSTVRSPPTAPEGASHRSFGNVPLSKQSPASGAAKRKPHKVE